MLNSDNQSIPVLHTPLSFKIISKACTLIYHCLQCDVGSVYVMLRLQCDVGSVYDVCDVTCMLQRVQELLKRIEFKLSYKLDINTNAPYDNINKYPIMNIFTPDDPGAKVSTRICQRVSYSF